MLGRPGYQQNKMADAEHSANSVRTDDLRGDLDNLEAVLPTLEEIGCSKEYEECTNCGELIFDRAISCKIDSCLYHFDCAGVDNDMDDEFYNNWLCPNCSTSGDEAEDASTLTNDGNTNCSTRKRKCNENQTRQRKKKDTAMRPPPKYLVADALANAVKYVVTILLSVKHHRIYSNEKFPNSKPIQDLTASLHHNSSHPTFVDFSRDLVKDMWDILTSIDKKQLCSNTYDIMLGKFHSYRLGNIRQKWDDLLMQLNITVPHLSPVSDVLLQYILRHLLETLTKERNMKDLPCDETSTTTGLSTNDHQVLNYISGFIPFALIKRFTKLNTHQAITYINILRSWRLNDADSESFVSYVKEWLEKQSRGYLFQPSWDLHVFFRTLEYVGRKHLTSASIRNYKDTNLHELLFDVFNKNQVVQNRWDVLLKDHELEAIAKIKLYTIMVKYWIKIRCTAYVKVYIDIRKAKDKEVSRKGEKGLRKVVDR